jgi:hypothetical protein
MSGYCGRSHSKDAAQGVGAELAAIQRIADELSRKARALADAHEIKLISAVQAVPDHDDTSAQFVRAMLLVMRCRHEYIGARFADGPAWNILACLYHAYLEGRLESVSGVALGACVPSTTALRWLRSLQESGLVSSAPDSKDSRRRRISISDAGATQMARYYATAARLIEAAINERPGPGFSAAA